MADAAPPHKPAKGFFVNVGSLVSARVFLALSQIIVLPIVARHLSVNEFAVMAMAMTVVVFCSVLSDAGLGRSLIRSEGYDLNEWSSVFWLLVGVGIALCLATLAIAPLWARFFDEPKLVGVLAALSVVPLFQALSAAPNAEIERRENYTGIARVQMTTTVISLALAVVLAIAGAGVWALVGQQIALAGVRLLGIAWLTQFRPRFFFSRALLGGHLRFARDALLVAAISATNAQVAVVAIGKIIGQTALGVFSMSERFSRMPQYGLAGPMSTVVYVRMAKAQKDKDRLVAIYLAAIRLMSLVLFPALGLIAASGVALFTVFLSDEWVKVAPIFALSIAGLAIEAIAVVILACLFRAVGRTDLHVRLSLESTILRAVLVTSAAFISLEAVAFSLTLWGILLVPRGWSMAARLIPLKMSDCLRAMAPSILVTAAFVALHLALSRGLDLNHVPEILLAMTLSFAAIGLTALLERKVLKQSIAVFRS